MLDSLKLGALGVIAAACGWGCESSPTQLVVVVDSDYEAPTPLASVEARTLDAASTEVSSQSFSIVGAGTETGLATFRLPLSFGIVPLGGDAGRRVVLEVEARTATGDLLVLRRAITGFLSGRILRLPMFLARSCEGATCPEGQTCTERGCEAEEIPPEDLMPVNPGEEFTDAGAPTDGASGDAAVCASTCEGGCAPVDCSTRTTCRCDDACGCELDCRAVDSCAPECVRESCVVDAMGVRGLDAVCGPSTECVILASEGEDVRVRCNASDRCEVDCTDATGCTLTCQTADSGCLVRCGGATDCSMTICPTGVVSCPGDILVCGRSCP